VLPKTRIVPSTPSLVLTAMEDAYTAKDSVGYTRLFDAAYQGLSFNPNDPGVPRIDFNWADEQLHIQKLAEKPTITTISLNFGLNVTWYSDLGDPPGWATIQRKSSASTLSITDGDNTYILPNDDLIEFKLIPTTPAPSSVTDTTWKIIRWTETHP